MNASAWLAKLLARWRAASAAGARPPSGPMQEIDIDLTADDAVPSTESTDYDVHSLGEPVEPPAAVRHHSR